jgi:hypothetical protein
MTKTALILALAIAVPAWAQDKPAEKPADAPAAAQQPEQPKPEAKDETPKKKERAARTHSRRMEDARHCLDKPTNTEIIKCAEAYL